MLLLVVATRPIFSSFVDINIVNVTAATRMCYTEQHGRQRVHLAVSAGGWGRHSQYSLPGRLLAATLNSRGKVGGGGRCPDREETQGTDR